LAAAGAPPVGRPVPAWLAYAAGAALEGAHRLLDREDEPILTRFAASELAHAQWFDISAARRDLGYAPRISIEEGLKRVEAWCRGEGAAQAQQQAGP
jgi:nucleoside-diphosphate-sugar epimerase